MRGLAARQLAGVLSCALLLLAGLSGCGPQPDGRRVRRPSSVRAEKSARDAAKAAEDKKRNAALIEAISDGDKEMVQTLLAQGADPNTKSTRANTDPAVMVATEGGDTEIASILLEHGANVDARDWTGFTSLIRAAQKNQTEVARVLLKHGANVNARDGLRKPYGESALIWAAQKGHTEMVQLLLEHGAEVDIRSATGVTPLFAAVRRGHTKAAEALLASDADPNVRLKNGCSALTAAAEEGHTEAVKLLLAHGADPNIVHGAGLTMTLRDGTRFEVQTTPLVETAQAGHAEIVRILLEHGADPNVRLERRGLLTEKYSFSTALTAAAECGRVETIKVLLAHGAEVNAGVEEGKTALDVAMALGWEEAVEVLLANGAVRSDPARQAEGKLLRLAGLNVQKTDKGYAVQVHAERTETTTESDAGNLFADLVVVVRLTARARYFYYAKEPERPHEYAVDGDGTIRFTLDIGYKGTPITLFLVRKGDFDSGHPNYASKGVVSNRLSQYLP